MTKEWNQDYFKDTIGKDKSEESLGENNKKDKPKK